MVTGKTGTDGTDAQRAELVGGVPCLDLVNTVAWRGVGPEAREDRLPDMAAAIRWGRQAGVLDAGAVRRLNAAAREDPRGAAAMQAQLLDLREAVHAIFTEADAGGSALTALNRVLAVLPARQVLVRNGHGFAWSAGGRGSEAGPFAALLAPLAWSAADLLTGPQRIRVRRCADAACGWLFLDTSRAGSRRWCSMESCGNRAKARRHQARLRRGRQSGAGSQVMPRSSG